MRQPVARTMPSHMPPSGWRTMPGPADRRVGRPGTDRCCRSERVPMGCRSLRAAVAGESAVGISMWRAHSGGMRAPTLTDSPPDLGFATGRHPRERAARKGILQIVSPARPYYVKHLAGQVEFLDPTGL